MNRQACDTLARETHIQPALRNGPISSTPLAERRPNGVVGQTSLLPTPGPRTAPKPDLTSQLGAFASGLGFGAFAFLSLRRSADDPVGYCLQSYITNVPDPWKETYEHENLHRQDPIVAMGRLKREIFAWHAEDPDLCLTDAHRHVAAELRAHDLCCGIIAPVHGPKGELSLLILASSDPDRDFDEMAMVFGPSIYWIALSSHAVCFSDVVDAAAPRGRDLTKREKECLFWTAKGKTSWETSRIIGRTETTVNFHLKKAMSKLNASNKCHAVTKAISRGFLYL